MKVRTRLFSKRFPDGKLFTDSDEVDLAMKSGDWCDAKWKVNEIYQIDRNDNESIIKSTDTIKLCECGCGNPAAPNKRFAHFHPRKKRMKKDGDSQNNK
jgi:hypothetical protein